MYRGIHVQLYARSLRISLFVSEMITTVISILWYQSEVSVHFHVPAVLPYGKWLPAGSRTGLAVGWRKILHYRLRCPGSCLPEMPNQFFSDNLEWVTSKFTRD
jgi:hypothetical protein